MDFFDVVNSRVSIRCYETRPVEDWKIKKIMDAARLAPSARNRQPWFFIIITDDEIKRKVYEATRDQRFILDAPVIIAAVGYPTNLTSSNGNLVHLVDLGIAGEHIALAATALGLGTCWVAAFYQDKMRIALNVPEDAHVVAIFTLGYPSEHPERKTRKELDEILFENQWGSPPPSWVK